MGEPVKETFKMIYFNLSVQESFLQLPLQMSYLVSS